MTVKFSLLRPTDKSGKTKTEPVSILVTVCNKNSRVLISTGLRIAPRYWNESGKVKPAYIKANEINQELLRIEESIIKSIRANNSIKGEGLKLLVANSICPPVPLQKKTVFSFIDSFIKESNKKPNTLKAYRTGKMHLENFCNKHSIDISWEAIDLNFYEAFSSYLYKLGHNDNSVGKTIKTLKTFISAAFDHDLHLNMNFKKKWFKVISNDVDEIYLSETEIVHFFDADVSGLPEAEQLERVKKIFVFGCWVGLRFGDLSKLSPNHVTNSLNGTRKMIRITTEKTGEDVMIPLLPMAEEIWNSWGGFPPKAPHNVEFNRLIKIIAEQAKINTPVQQRNTIKGKVEIKWVPKYKMVKAHTCRRSFATNLYLKGVESRTIMAATGHKTEKAFLKYIRVSKEQHASRMFEAFQPKGESVLMKAN
jgi:site-specific recombinase XerD